MRRRLVLVVLFAVLFALGWWAGRVASRDLYADLDTFVEVLHKVEANYVDPVDPHTLMEGAIRGMLRHLDPHSQYLDSKALASLQSSIEGSFGGVGIELVVRENYPTVVAPIEGTPAWEAGIHSGDVIVSVDGKSTYGLSVQDAADRLRGPEGTQVKVGIAREGEPEEHALTLTRRIIERRAVPYAFVEGDVGYLRLTAFSETTGQETRAMVERLRGQGAKRLVLDLRMNPGGLLDQAVGVAEQFVPKGTLVVYTHGRARSEDQRYYAREARPETSWPMVVLVDGGSASASEIVAGALQDLDRALVIGTTSFGKGSVQHVFRLKDDAGALKLTTALYYTPSGRSIDHPVRDTLDDELDEEDTAPAPSDSAPRPVFRTHAGRRVYGGGGITPDVVVEPDTLRGLSRVVESRNLAFRFANRWLNLHPQARPAEAGAPWDEFLAWLRGEKVEFTPADAQASRPQLERALRREMARRMLGDGAAARVALEGDPVWARARGLLEQSRRPADLFAQAVTAPDRPAARGAHKAPVKPARVPVPATAR